MSEDADGPRDLSDVYLVSVTLFQARNIVSDEAVPDVFCVLSAGVQRRRTCVRSKVDPVWNQTFHLMEQTPFKTLELKFKDKDTMNADDYLGSSYLDLSKCWHTPTAPHPAAAFDAAWTVIPAGKIIWVPLLVGEEIRGEVQVRVKCQAVDVNKFKSRLQYTSVTHLLRVVVKEGRDLNDVTKWVGLGNPFAELRWGETIYRTHVIKDSLNPKWNSSTTLWLDEHQHKQYRLQLWVFDDVFKFKADVAGGAEILAKDIFQKRARQGEDPSKVEWEEWIDLAPSNPATDAELTAQREEESTHDALRKPAAPKHTAGKVLLQFTLWRKEQVESDLFHMLTKGQELDLENSERALKCMGIHLTLQQSQEWFDSMDKDRNGHIDRGEFARYMSSFEAQSSAPMRRMLLYVCNHDREDLRVMQKIAFKAARVLHQKQKAFDGLVVKERESGVVVMEHIPKYISIALEAFFDRKKGKPVVNHALEWLQTKASQAAGRKADSADSKKRILPFIAEHQLDVTMLEKPVEEYATLNDFFARKFKPGVRPTYESDDPKIAVCPADCRLSVFSSTSKATDLWIKGDQFTIERLLGEPGAPFASRFLGGPLCIARLAPQDYHRWHFPVGGTVGENLPIVGSLYTVNPFAINNNVNVFTENKRTLTLINSPEFGSVLVVAVGATMVGSIHYDPVREVGSSVMKGEYHGYFKFGGSTVILLFEPGRIAFAPDLLRNSSEQLETLVKVGTLLGEAVAPDLVRRPSRDSIVGNFDRSDLKKVVRLKSLLKTGSRLEKHTGAEFRTTVEVDDEPSPQSCCAIL